MSPPLPVRWVILGNSGSGKSTLAARLGQALDRPVHDLDLVHWHPDGAKRDEAEARARVAAIAATEAWIVEGVYGWLAEVALVRATRLIWLDIPWDACRAGLLARGLRRGMTVTDQDALLAWAQDYRTRTTSSSFTGHERLYRAFAGEKAHLRTRGEVDAFVP
ncbi:AAA family ATPase [Methylobacterium sp. EM32]|uniref:AAA family ATPase n=1 Tax=Methylobacterium sp. EM32 TaxID=3163481 RepID=UPI00339ED59A